MKITTVADILKLDLQKELTRTMLFEWFSEDLFKTNQEISIKVNNKMIKSTLGIYIFNKFLLPAVLFDTEYVNEPLNKKVYSEFINMLSEAKNSSKLITAEEFASVVDRLSWLSAIMLKIHGGGITSDGIIVSDKTSAAIKDIIAKLPDEPSIEQLQKTDNSVIKLLKDDLGDSDLGKIMTSGSKGSFSNNMKTMFGYRGIVDGKLIRSSVENTTFDDFSKVNGLVGSYGRSVQTRIGGYQSKLVNNGLSHTKVDVKNRDCGSKLFLTVKLNNLNEYNMRYVRLSGKGSFEVLTSDNFDTFKGKFIDVRTPMFCLGKNGYCVKCYGEMFKLNGVKDNLAPAVAAITADTMNKSMKSFHDLSPTYNSIDIKKTLLK